MHVNEAQQDNNASHIKGRVPSPPRDDCIDSVVRAPKVGALGDAWINCREGRKEGI